MDIPPFIEHDDDGVPLPFPLQAILGLSFLPYTSTSLETDILHPSLFPSPSPGKNKKPNREPAKSIDITETSKSEQTPPMLIVPPEIQKGTKESELFPSTPVTKKNKMSSLKKLKKPFQKSIEKKKSKLKKHQEDFTLEKFSAEIEVPTKTLSATDSPNRDSISHLDVQIASITKDLDNLRKEQEKLRKLQEESASSGLKSRDIKDRMSELDKQTLALHELVVKHLQLVDLGKEKLKAGLIEINLEKVEDNSYHSGDSAISVKSLKVKKKRRRWRRKKSTEDADDNKSVQSQPMIPSKQLKSEKKSSFGKIFKKSSIQSRTMKLFKQKSQRSFSDASEEEQVRPPIEIRVSPQAIHNSFSVPRSESFIRVNDLDFPENVNNLGVPKSLPSVKADSKLKVSDFFHLDSVDTPYIIDGIMKLGVNSCLDGIDTGMTAWKPMDETKKILNKRQRPQNIEQKTNIPGWINPLGKEVLVWSSKFCHNEYGCELPVVKARGIVQTSPRNLAQYLLDSERVQEYNKMSLGRADTFVFQKGLESQSVFDGGMVLGEMKIVRSLSKAPLVKHPIELVSLMCGKELDKDKDKLPENLRGYIIVSRAAIQDNDTDKKQDNEKTSKSEMLLGVNLIRYIDDDVEENCNRAEFTTITQMYSPMVPMMVAKRIGLMSAANFIRDIQTVFA